MTPEEIEDLAESVGEVSTLPGTFDKRFVNMLWWRSKQEPKAELSPKQIKWVFKLAYKYRRQIPATYEHYKFEILIEKDKP